MTVARPGVQSRCLRGELRRSGCSASAARDGGGAHGREASAGEHTEDWQELLPLCWWPEQAEVSKLEEFVQIAEYLVGRGFIAEGVNQCDLFTVTLKGIAAGSR